jgi:hypothetical protein
MHIIDTSITHSAENPMAMLEKFGNVKANQNPAASSAGLNHRKSDLSDLRSVKCPTRVNPSSGDPSVAQEDGLAGQGPAMTMQIRNHCESRSL